MNKLSAFEFEELNRHVDDGWIRRQICSYAPLFIYTYSTNTELEENWDKYTLMSRGLVLNDKGDIVIRCVPKFFNAGQKFAENVRLNDEKTQITMKNDGYLIQVKKDSRYGLIVTSKGSFTSPMVTKAKELINEEELEEDYTYICELCCNFPGDEAIIVKRWDSEPKLSVWAVINPRGSEIDLLKAKIPKCLERTAVFSYPEATEYLKRLDVEGVVGKNGDKRVKFKTEHFMMMHRLISDVRKIRVWELLSKGLDLDSINIPDEFMPIMKEWRGELLYAKKSILQEAYYVADKYAQNSDKEFALSDVDPFLKKLVFNIRKENIKANEEIIWRKIRNDLKEEK